MLAKLYPSGPWRRSRSTASAEAQSIPPGTCRPSDASTVTPRDLRELNACLTVLAGIFPDVQPEVFREMLSTFSEVSRLQLVTESLLRNKIQYVQGRWRVPKPGVKDQSNTAENDLTAQQRFRSEEYRTSVKAALTEEFRGFSRSSLKAVLAEHNYSYIETREALLTLSSQSWRYSIAQVLLRRKTTSTTHPLVQWRRTADGARKPELVSTKCAELDHELDSALIKPFRDHQIKEQLNNDRQLAEKLNDTEAEIGGALFDCECCFIPNSFENISLCDRGGHYLCTNCVRHTFKEAIYGQGWAQSINVERGLLKCIAAGAVGDADCLGCIADDDVRRALDTETARNDMLVKFEQRLATDSLIKSRLPLSKCSFCSYAEFENVLLPKTAVEEKSYRPFGLALVILCLVCLLDILLDIKHHKMIFLTSIAVLISSYRHLLQVTPIPTSVGAMTKQQPHFGRKFICRNPSCRQISCVSCSAVWNDIHVCHQSSRQALRTYVESAVTDAIKRTCPQCNIAFVKSSGCNKLVCVCGYAMCYVCRKDIGKEGYMHFCQHFRPDGGSCADCERCDLYRVEDEEIVMERAREQAIKEWKERERLVQGDAQKGGEWSVDEEAKTVVGTMMASQTGHWSR